MDRLRCIVISDPSRGAAEHLASQTQRLAAQRIVATTGDDALAAVAGERPEMILLSLELQHPEAVDVATQLLAKQRDLFIVATFRELAVPMMERLGKIGVDDFIPQPIELTALFRAASERFNMHLRQHVRRAVTVDVTRTDGVVIGRTRDVSEGGMRMDAIHPVREGESILVSLALPGREDTPLRVRCQILAVEGEAPQPVVARIMFQNLRGEEYRRLSAFLHGLGETDATDDTTHD